LFCFARDGVTGAAILLVFAACLASIARFTCGTRVTAVEFFVAACEFLFAQGTNVPDLPKVSHLVGRMTHGCIFCTCVAAIDAPVMIIVVAG
jgi:hypothetical protein